MKDEEINQPEQEALELEVEDESFPLNSDGAPPEALEDAPLSVEDLVETLETVAIERDDFRDSLQRLQAEFENFRRRSSKEAEQRISHGISRLVEALLPVLDACDAATAQGLDEITPIRNALETVLANNGLTRIEALGVPFDPTQHEAMSLESGGGDEQVVVEELRAGYRWGQSILRPAMVKVSGQ
ncbi:MAG: nucleotide exchange factor GrpE [Acidimicrobiales bacterium]|nr:nucleotide exchange factor GrpE [Acidimicrobiales bacterium]